ncbi:hypothetical protein [Piscinibacter sakaiensis]|uniref:hypothetical protein n=1 Tax=Piscinibacter sakaiensis TaxID=1547922 RepID=UPI003AAB6189
MKPARSQRQAARGARGLATLATLLLLLLAALLAAAWAQRSALNEIHSAANQWHSAGAREAAEAGLEWAQAMLNSSHAIGADCQPSRTAGALGFRSRYLHTADAYGRLVVAAPAAAASPLKIACSRDAAGWSCACPTDAAPAAPPSSRDGHFTPSFLVELAAGAWPGSIELLAIGCSDAARPCLAGASRTADASARLRVSLALLPALMTAPAATLTVRGSIDAGTAGLGLHNADAWSGGLAAQAGGAIVGSNLRIGSTPGAAPASALLGNDPALAGLAPERLFSRHFGTDAAHWKYLPGVQRLSCRGGDCSAELLALLEPNADIARIAVDGDLQLANGLQIGSRERPVLLVIDGDLLLDGRVQLHGIVWARNMRWDGVSVDGGGLLHGAALLSGNYSGNAGADLVYDPSLMPRLKQQSGTWVRVPGSWRDE